MRMKRGCSVDKAFTITMVLAHLFLIAALCILVVPCSEKAAKRWYSRMFAASCLFALSAAIVGAVGVPRG